MNPRERISNAGVHESALVPDASDFAIDPLHFARELDARRPGANDDDVPEWIPCRALARARNALVLVCALLPSPGCSYLFVDAVPSGHAQMRAFDCTTSMLMPVGDTGLATAFTYSAFDSVLGANEHDRPGDLAVPVVASVAFATLAVASATYGYISTDRCRGAKGDLARRSATEITAETPGSHR